MLPVAPAAHVQNLTILGVDPPPPKWQGANLIPMATAGRSPLPGIEDAMRTYLMGFLLRCQPALLSVLTTG